MGLAAYQEGSYTILPLAFRYKILNFRRIHILRQILHRHSRCKVEETRIPQTGLLLQGTMDVDAMDERRPLLGTNAGRPEPAAAPRDVSDNGVDNGVDDFDVKVDADDPMEWPAAFKWSIVALLAFMAFTVYVHRRASLTFSHPAAAMFR